MSVLVFQCRCCPGQWYLWPHDYPPPRHLGKNPRIRWRVMEIKEGQWPST